MIKEDIAKVTPLFIEYRMKKNTCKGFGLSYEKRTVYYKRNAGNAESIARQI